MVYSKLISTLMAFSFLATGSLTPAKANIPSQTEEITPKVNIIPLPSKVLKKTGKSFSITEKTNIRFTSQVKAQANYLQETLGKSTGWDLTLVENSKNKKGIILSVDTLLIQQQEGYRLEVTEKYISIVGHDAAGVFYGIQSLLQLLPPAVHSSFRQKGTEWEVNPIFIEDAPQRPWRGMMLDVARYFYTKEFVKKYIDMMAMYKLNKLQFHFIDDSGWRLEIKKYPRLTEVGAWAGTDIHRLGGFYTQEDIKEIIEYAEVRGVEVIPEIEFPAHMLSAIVAYPWLSCTEKQHEVPVKHFISRDLLCVGKESSFQFLRDVLEETVALFPSKFINIGGDEAIYTRWEQCPKCQDLMKREGLTKASDLQGYLTNKVAEMMAEKGKTVVGWEEIFMRGKVSTPLVGLIWHNVADTLQAERAGHKAVLTPCTHMYYDFPEGKTPGELKAATWMPPVSLEKTYSMPINDFSEGSTTLGVQACFWSDQFIHGTQLQEYPYLNENRSEKYAEYFTFPRLLALSEVAWKKESERDYKDFLHRLGFHYQRLDYKNCNYRVPEPHVNAIKKLENGSYEYHLSPSIQGSEIRYTVNGTYPTPYSPVYKKPVVVENKNLFRAMTVLSPSRYSLPIYEAPDYSAYRQQYGDYTASWKTLQIQYSPSPFRFECSGKITENGSFRITFIRSQGENLLHLGNLKVYKKDEVIAEVNKAQEISTTTPVASYEFEINNFEAGTPYYIVIEAHQTGKEETSGMIFIKKDK